MNLGKMNLNKLKRNFNYILFPFLLYAEKKPPKKKKQTNKQLNRSLVLDLIYPI